MGACNRQLLANSKCVHCEVESEGSWRQSYAPMNTNDIRHIRWDETAIQAKVQRLQGHRDIYNAGTWNESGLPYRGRPPGRVETEFEAWSKAHHEESSEASVSRTKCETLWCYLNDEGRPFGVGFQAQGPNWTCNKKVDNILSYIFKSI